MAVFFEEIKRIEDWNREETANGTVNGDHAQAGYNEIISDFGYMYSLYNLSDGDFTKSKEILRSCVGEVYRWQPLQSRNNAAEKKYQEIMNMKRR